MRGEAILLTMLLAGCVAADAPAAAPVATPSLPTDEPAAAMPNGSVGAPELRIGRAWTYEGSEFYNEDRSFTVVVAEERPEGWLFAGGSEDDLVYEALWWSRWYQVHDRALNRVDFDRALLRFPLFDGASWPYSDALTLTARAAQVDTPLGKDEGFVIEGANERVTMRSEYSPRAQNLVRLHMVAADGTLLADLRMTRVADDQRWVWYELGELVAADMRHPAVLDVPEGYDHVIVSAGGTTGGRVRLDGPGGASWSTEFDGAEAWRHAMLPATPGKWTGIAAGRPFVPEAPPLPADAPLGWSYMHVAPVRWLRG